jgi:[acyl-carrier-protein] S-malonyltransferase
MSNINTKKVALVFPGQGSQAIGMGQDICNVEPDSKAAFHLVANECDFELAKLAWTGPEEALRRTCHTQPALLATSAACLQALRRYWPEAPLCVAGHSLGELSALWAAEVITLQQAAQLTVLRGQLMENSLPGAMSAIIGMDHTHVEHVCQEFGVVVANYNTPHQQVISGSKEQMEKINAKITELKGKVIPLQVGGAFHSPLMAEANQNFAAEIEKTLFKNSICPVIQNVDAKAHTQANELKNNLAQQMTSSVRWVETVETMFELGAEAFIEVGSGKVLSGLIKKIDRSAVVLQVSDPASLKATLQELSVPLLAESGV